MPEPRCPALYQINTRVWLTELSRALGRRATLDDIPDAELDRLAELGFDWVWFLSVWQTGPAAQAISRANPGRRRESAEALRDLKDEDIAGSGFAIQSYTVHRDLGGASALARLRERLKKRRLKLMLDFVPNHMAPDHAWLDEHQDYFVHSSAWEGNWTADCFIACSWRRGDGERRLVVVNYATNQSQCYVRLPVFDVTDRTVLLKDLMGTVSGPVIGERQLQGRET